jgi:hypothetical protein
MIEEIVSSMGTSWLGSATRPSVAATAERPSSSGMPAATSAPKATTRMARVIGMESVSAFLKSSSKDCESALLELASPNCPTKTPRFWAATRSTAATTGPTASSVCSSSPRSSKFTRAERPSREIWFFWFSAA